MLDYNRIWFNDIWRYHGIASGFIADERERQAEIEKTRREMLAQLKGK